MRQPLTSRNRGTLELVQAVVKELVREPIREAVQEALDEEAKVRTASASDDEGGGQSRSRLVLIALGFAAATYLARRWNRRGSEGGWTGGVVGEETEKTASTPSTGSTSGRGTSITEEDEREAAGGTDDETL